jgi:hypothetical protein
MHDLERAIAALQTFKGTNLARTIGDAERSLEGADTASVVRLKRKLFGDGDLFRAAVLVKTAAAQIDNLLHAVGILAALPHILEPGERVVKGSLGAAGGSFDLLTTARVAEFKFIHWKPKGNSLRLMVVLEDFIKLAEARNVPKRRELYLLGPQPFLRFAAGRTKLHTMFGKRNAPLLKLLAEINGEWTTVGDYFTARRSAVEIIDLHRWLPKQL